MTYNEFKTKWLGSDKLNYDGSYGNQCVDVYRMYVKEVLGCPQSPPVTGAKNVWDTYLPEYFERIANTPEGIPKEGDIVIWGMAPYGHIAICDHATLSTLTCLEQNWLEGGTVNDGKGKVELRLHANYNNLLGWLRFKGGIIEDMTQEEKNILKFLAEQGAGEGKVREAFGYLNEKASHDAQMATLSQKVLELDALTKQLGEKIEILGSEVTASNKIIEDWQSRFSTANEQARKALEQVETITEEKNKYRRLYESQLDASADKMTVKQLFNLIVKKLTKKK